jgi:hypothetical protein
MKKSISDHLTGYIMKHIDDGEKIHGLSKFVEKFFCEMDESYAEIKEGFITEIEDFVDELDEEMIHQVAENLKHKNGDLSGIKWSKEEVASVVKQYDVASKLEACGKKYDCLHFWLAMNYVYATHHSNSRTINGYVDLAIDELCNKNICFDHLVKKIFEKM